MSDISALTSKPMSTNNVVLHLSHVSDNKSEKSIGNVTDNDEITSEITEYDQLKLEKCQAWLRNQNKTPAEYDEITDETLSILENNRIKTFRESRKRKGGGCDDVTEMDSTSGDTTIVSQQPKKKPKPFRDNEHVITLECEWKKCHFITDGYVQFLSHVKNHMHELPISQDEDNEDEYLCAWDICKFKTKDSATIVRHVNFHSYHTKIKTVGMNVHDFFKWPRCNQDSENRNTIPEFNYDFSCGWIECDQTFKVVQEFFDHVKSHLLSLIPFKDKNVKTKYECGWKGCKYTTRVHYRLNTHSHTHTTERMVACPHCGTMFADKSKFFDHCNRQMPTNLRNFQCGQCSKLFSSARILRDHMRVHVNMYKCSLCDMTCFAPYKLAQHIRYRHLDERPFKCHLCTHSCLTKYDLESHVLTHDENNGLACDEPDCTYTCKAVISLQRHFTTAHGHGIANAYCCHCCVKRCKKGADLTKHLISVHGFCWPSGHSRFRYEKDEDGFYHLQTTRYESLEVSQQITSNTSTNLEIAKSLTNCYQISKIREATTTEPTKITLSTNEKIPLIISSFDIKLEENSSKSETSADKNNRKQTRKRQVNKSVLQSRQKTKNDRTGKNILPGRDTIENENSVENLTKTGTVDSDVERIENNSVNDQQKTESRDRLNAAEHQTDSNLGSIEDFSVMQRYIKKPIVITIEDVDSVGNVIKSEVINSDDIVYNNVDSSADLNHHDMM